jgi:beta-N-acetylhexosaminidase
MKNLIFTILTAIIFSPLAQCNPLNPGQMIITGFKGTSIKDPQIIELKTLIDQKAIGGVIFFKRNIENKSQLTRLIQYLSKDTPIFVAIDHEGGIVNRLTHPSFNLKTPSPELFCKLSKEKQRDFASQISKTLKEVGINVNLGGVVDVAPLIYPSSICKYKRCFSDSQELITACTSELFNAHKNEQLFFALKHFPGHGSTPVDSHYNLPDITSSHSEYDFMPYFKLVDPNSKYNMVMVGHLMNTQVDQKYPASLSKNHIKMLTNDLRYNGLIITDDLNMGALYNVSKDKAKIATIAAMAGNHLLLFEYLTLSEIKNISLFIKEQAKLDEELAQHIETSNKLIIDSLSIDDT